MLKDTQMFDVFVHFHVQWLYCMSGMYVRKSDACLHIET